MGRLIHSFGALEKSSRPEIRMLDSLRPGGEILRGSKIALYRFGFPSGGPGGGPGIQSSLTVNQPLITFSGAWQLPKFNSKM
jgi:hypothetical protein